MENKRAFGDGLEDFVINKAKDYGINLRKFTNSGAKNQNDSDFQDVHFQFECKRNGTKSKAGTNDISFSTKEWNKLLKEARARNKKAAMVNGCLDLNKSTVTLKLTDFFDLYTAYLAAIE